MNNLWIVVNTECNMRCSHCFENKFEKGKVSVDHVKTFLSKLNHGSTINLFGGEPTLDQTHFLTILDLVYKSEKIDRITIFSNGRFNISLLDELENYKDKIEWQLSVQTCDPNIKDVKGEIDTLKAIRDRGFKFTIYSVVLKEQRKLLLNLIDYTIKENMFDNLNLAVNRIETDLKEYSKFLIEVSKKLIDYSFSLSKRAVPSIVERLLGPWLECPMCNSSGFARYSTLGVDGQMYACHHVSNIKPDNKFRKLLLDQGISVDEWSLESKFKNELEYDADLNILTPCVLEHVCDNTRTSKDVIREIKLDLTNYIRTKISEIRSEVEDKECQLD
ncbi:MAG: radical SAM protein [Paraclostridium sp.]